MKVRLRKCKFCGVTFTPTYSTMQAVCSHRCSIEYSKTVQKAKDNREWQREKKERKKALLSHSEWLNLFQKVFNTYIRARDNGKPCISCGCQVENGHASHMLSVGSHPNLRFNEDNVHLSCIECNLHKHGNLVEYSLRLPERIGKERFEKLVSDSKKTVLKLSIPEIEEKIKEYKEKTKSII